MVVERLRSVNVLETESKPKRRLPIFTGTLQGPTAASSTLSKTPSKLSKNTRLGEGVCLCVGRAPQFLEAHRDFSNAPPFKDILRCLNGWHLQAMTSSFSKLHPTSRRSAGPTLERESGVVCLFEAASVCVCSEGAELRYHHPTIYGPCVLKTLGHFQNNSDSGSPIPGIRDSEPSSPWSIAFQLVPSASLLVSNHASPN